MVKRIEHKYGTIIEGNHLQAIIGLELNSVDLVLTSPPYDDTRKYKKFQFDAELLFELLYGVVKPGGVVVWVTNDRTKDSSESGSSFRAALTAMEQGFLLYDTMIYAKVNAKPLNHRRYNQEFEYMFVFSKDTPKTFNGIRELSKHAGKKQKPTSRQQGRDELRRVDKVAPIKATKLKGNIWYYQVGNNRSATDEIGSKHPGIFPEALARDHIYTWTNPGDVVLDPMNGSGTTTKVAKAMGRQYVGVDLAYSDLAVDRLMTVSWGEWLKTMRPGATTI